MEKVKSIQPPSVVETEHGKIYYFFIEMESGLKGQFSSKKEQQSKFEVGKEYDIEVEEKVSKKGNKYNFINIKKEPFAGRGNYVNHWDKEEVKKDTSVGIALECAVEIAKRLPDGRVKSGTIIEIHGLIYNWIMKDIAFVYRRQGAIKAAVNTMYCRSLNVSSSADIFRTADEYLGLWD